MSEFKVGDLVWCVDAAAMAIDKMRLAFAPGARLGG